MPCGRRRLRELIPLSRLVVLTGGGDPDPALYGMGEEGCGRIERHRSRWDLEVYRAAREAGAAILGICMGMQIAAVAEGVPLVRDIPLETGSDLDHAGSPERPLSHPVTLAPGTLLGGILGDRAEVSSFHHQAVAAVPEGFREAARAPDGIIEAAESADGRVVCVQWHPERDWTGDVLMKALLWS
jgi:putative glutamine amidotransferase